MKNLRHIERIAVACDSKKEAKAYRAPMTAAWAYYTKSGQFLVELNDLTRYYPISADFLAEALRRVYSNPESN